MMSEAIYIFLLLFLTLLAWFLGHSAGVRKRNKKPGGELTKHYFQGINYLLNEQPDQAIDVFIHSVEVTPQTLETHLSLGNLMRQKGEVDRAIRVHQNLLSRPSLNQQQVRQAHLELARDFLKAGLFDRAERLFLELVDDTAGDFRQQSLRHLVQIYRDEQEWEKAIRAASMMEKKLFGRAGDELAIEQAHFCCELAEKARVRGDHLDVRRYLKSALKFNKDSARANILWGNQEMSALNFQKALKRYRLVPQQQPDYLPHVLERVRHCYENLGDQEGLLRQYRAWFDEYPGNSILKVLVEALCKKEGGIRTALQFLTAYLEKVPSIKGVSALLDIHLTAMADGESADAEGDVAVVKEGVVKENLVLLKSMLDSLALNQPSYRCVECGFKGTQLHWLCPQCRCWETVKPVRGVIGE
jgi:lipopolysaccharide assembly protein B